MDTNTSEALDHFPSNDQNHLAGTAAANLDVKSSGSNAHPPSKMSAKGLRNSFRKLVKPLVKKRTTEVEEGDVLTLSFLGVDLFGEFRLYPT